MWHYTTHNSSICSDEGLTLETAAFQSLYGGQFTLLTPLMNQILVYHSPTDAAAQFLQKLIPFISKSLFTVYSKVIFVPDDCFTWTYKVISKTKI